jgi:hypothetical protein
VIGWGGDLSANQLPVADGENLTYLTIYSAAPLSDITEDGDPVALNRSVPDLGYQAQDLYVRIPSQGVKVVRAHVHQQVEPIRPAAASSGHRHPRPAHRARAGAEQVAARGPRECSHRP